MIVVSDIGEQWSPNTAPVNTAPIVAYKMVPVSPPLSVKASGTAIGINIAVVPHDVPVENAIIQPSINTTSGMTPALILPASNPTK